jgi:hypothetical protein
MEFVVSFSDIFVPVLTTLALSGYTPNYAGRPQESGLSRNECIGGNKEAAWTVFRRLAVEKTHCGDAG